MTRKITGLATLFFLTFFISCLDTEEKIVINKDNSGLYAVTIDLSKMLTLMDQMGQKAEDKSNAPEKKDSTVYFKSFTDTASALTAREKELFADGSLRMRIDEEAKELVIMLNFPFKKIADVPELKSSYLSVIDRLGVSKNLKNPGDSSSAEEIPPGVSGSGSFLNPAQDAYAFVATAGKISNSLINKDAFNNKIQNDSTLQMLQSMTMMMGDMNFKTTIVVPGKIKKHLGNQAVLSQDKKTVTFQTTLTDLLNRPEAAEYSVEY